MEKTAPANKKIFYTIGEILAVGLCSWVYGLWVWLFLFVSILLCFNMACANWWRMGMRHKSIIHLFAALLLNLLLIWARDEVGQRPVPRDSMLSLYAALLFLIAIFYVAIQSGRDVKKFLSSGAHPHLTKDWNGWLFLVFIVAGGFISIWSADRIAKSAGLCKFPPAYYLLSPNVEPTDGARLGLISINDFDCKLYGNSIPSRFANSQNGNQPVPFEEFYSRYIFADYLHENGDVFIDHYIWITKDKITDSDVKSAMEYDSRSEGKTRITNISIP